MPRVPHNVAGGANVALTGVVQGFVYGDHNEVDLHFHSTTHESFVPREAPPLPAHWIERSTLVNEATAALTSQAGAIVALVGMGGAGKSRLAARTAGAMAATFPRGCFWIDIAAGDIDDALLRMALAFGHDISPLKSREARANTVRSLLNGQRALIVLDDVWSADAIAGFLPPPPECAVLLTTRNDAVAAASATHVVPIDRFTIEDGVALLASLTGADRAEPALAQIAESLGSLPLALELAAKFARQQNRRPGFSWPHFATALTDATKRLGLGLAGTTVRAAFDATWTRALDREGQQAFARLGLFEPGDISTAEAASAWDASPEAALDRANALADLSLVQRVDAVTLRLHPLLADYAMEKARELADPERIAAHQRIADHAFERAAVSPRTMSDLRPVLRSHWHAGAAGDRERAKRVYPWFEKAGARTAVKAFLIDHGQPRRHARHERIQWALLKDAPLWARTWGSYRLGEALADAGELTEARQHLEQAVTMLSSPEVDEESRALGLSRFLMKLGHVLAQLGDLDGAVTTMRRMVECDRRSVERGNIHGARSGALIGLLQLGDLVARSQRAGSEAESAGIYQEVHAEAVRSSEAHAAVMAAQRLANLLARVQPAQASGYVHEALTIGRQNPAAFAGRQGARYARLLAGTAAELSFNGEPAVDDTLALLALAIESADQSDAQTEKGYALYALGNFFEHYHLLERESPLGAAWACYALANTCVAEHEDGSPLNTQERIDRRLAPRIAENERASLATAVNREPWTLVNAALAPLQIRINQHPAAVS